MGQALHNCQTVVGSWAANWWLRSPISSSSTNFYNVNNNGTSNNNNASNANGVAFSSSHGRRSNRKVKPDQTGEKESLSLP